MADHKKYMGKSQPHGRLLYGWSFAIPYPDFGVIINMISKKDIAYNVIIGDIPHRTCLGSTKLSPHVVEIKGKWVYCKHFYYVFMISMQGGLQEWQIHSHANHHDHFSKISTSLLVSYHLLNIIKFNSQKPTFWYWLQLFDVSKVLPCYILVSLLCSYEGIIYSLCSCYMIP